MKKILTVFIVVLLAATLAAPALAHGSHRGARSRTQITVCTIENCTQTGQHRHNGTTYSAHHYGDGHNYHGYCDIANCTQSGYHAHDGVYCFGHTSNDGHSYHRAGRGHH